MKTALLSTLSIVALAGLTAPAMAQNAQQDTDLTTAKTDSTSEATMTDALPGLQDNAYVILSGEIQDVRDDEFDLKTAADVITIELDRFGWAENTTDYLSPGMSVTINGFVDDDLFEGREVEAFNLRLNDEYMYYYTTEQYPIYSYGYFDKPEVDGSFVSTTGEVSEISGEEFKVSTASASIKVDASELTYNPFDDEGIQKIENGDRVYVFGELDTGFFESTEILADRIVELQSTQDRNLNQ